MCRFKKSSWYFVVLYRLENILGLNPLNLTKQYDIAPSRCGPIYTIFQIIFFGYVCSKVFTGRFYMKLPGETKIMLIVDLSITVMKFLETVTFFVSSGFHQKRLIKIIHTCEKIKDMFYELGVTDDHNRYIKKFTLIVLSFNAIFVSTALWTIFNLSTAAAAIDMNWRFMYHVLRMITFNVVLLFCFATLFVRRQFYHLNEKLKNLTTFETSDIKIVESQ